MGESVSLFREPDAGNLPVRFDEREQETEPSQTGLRGCGESRVTCPPGDYSHCACSRLYSPLHSKCPETGILNVRACPPRMARYSRLCGSRNRSFVRRMVGTVAPLYTLRARAIRGMKSGRDSCRERGRPACKQSFPCMSNNSHSQARPCRKSRAARIPPKARATAASFAQVRQSPACPTSRKSISKKSWHPSTLSARSAGARLSRPG